MLKTFGMKPYIPQLVQALNKRDPDRKMELAEFFLKNIGEDPTYVGKVW